MAEPDRNGLGDGRDNYAGAAQNIGQALRQANSAVHIAKTGAEGGRAVAALAKGAAAGGPYGALLSAAWSMRHTLYRILICVCLILLIFVVLLASLPSVVTNATFGLDGSEPTGSLSGSYSALSSAVASIVAEGYNSSLDTVDEMIEHGGYNYRYSMNSLINNAQASTGYDVSYILAAYSVSVAQKSTSEADMRSKLETAADRMFPVTAEEKTDFIQPDDSEDGENDSTAITYLQCTIHPFDTSVIASAFGLDPAAPYDSFGRTYGDVIASMSNALKMSLYGTLETGTGVNLTDEEMISFVNQQKCSDTRKYILSTALSLVGKVPYFWGGKSAPGWNEEWGTPKVVTASGSKTTGTTRPYGLDCSGFTAWVYETALGIYIGGGTASQHPNSSSITPDQLLPGDLGFLAKSGGGWEHVLMFAGYNSSGQRMWVHSSLGSGVVLNSPSYESRLVLRRPSNVDYSQTVGIVSGGLPANGSTPASGEPLYSLTVDVTHYCDCKKCCGSDAHGVTASGKHVEKGMVAMSSEYPFGTQIMINGTMYTVEDRGDSTIEGNKSRVDIYVGDHNYALKLGRYKTTAYIYRIGR